jgi:hypothetical protein
VPYESSRQNIVDVRVVSSNVMRGDLRSNNQPFVYGMGTKCIQALNFLEQFSLVQRNNFANFSVCSFQSH